MAVNLIIAPEIAQDLAAACDWYEERRQIRARLNH